MSRLPIFALEHSRAAYLADFVLYGIAAAALAVFLLAAVPPGQRLGISSLCLIGLVSWSLIEYVLHRFVLHGLKPFCYWHAEHHQRPRAFISVPTILSIALIVTLVFLPSWFIAGLWRASALTLGMVCGYLIYAMTHHATHYWRAEHAWLKKRKRWHAMHHQAHAPACCFGVTSSLWDYVFGTDGK